MKIFRTTLMLCVLGLASVGASPNPVAPSLAPSLAPKPLLEQAFTALKVRDWKSAAKAFEAARSEKALEYRALLGLALAYQQLEECPKAISPLREMQQRANRKKLKVTDAKFVRRGLFMLARCYAQGMDAGRSLFILNGYLLDPHKYTNELRQSLNLIDFGGLRTQSDFQSYEKAARKSLAKIGASADAPATSEFDGGVSGPIWNETTNDPASAPGVGSGSGF